MQRYTGPDGEKVTVFPEPPNAMSFYRALMAAMEAERALEKARAEMPDYRPTTADIDHYGAELSAFNKAVHELGCQLGIER